jgi:hypothetical protein
VEEDDVEVGAGAVAWPEDKVVVVGFEAVVAAEMLVRLAIAQFLQSFKRGGPKVRLKDRVHFCGYALMFGMDSPALCSWKYFLSMSITNCITFLKYEL